MDVLTLNEAVEEQQDASPISQRLNSDAKPLLADVFNESDVAQAFFQWGKYGQACTALRAAEQTAPQELAARAPVRTLARNLAALAPPGTRRDTARLADRIGAYT